MSDKKTLGLFGGAGIELEYMIVNRETLDVLPVADELIKSVVGSYSNDYEKEGICWSNELALHVIELKTCGPVVSFSETAELFQQDIRLINDILNDYSGMLMPTGAHPWMDPCTEAKLWPHGQRTIYEAYHRIFNCEGHGWTNLQSCHLNLPFNGSDEFGRLHAAIRLVLPIIPALAASTPILDSRRQPFLDTRMEYYRTNSARISSITGEIIPEPIFTPVAYNNEIFERMYRDIEPFDPEGTLRDEWLNARGAIARFDRNAIEIRIIDIQECSKSDLAITAGINAVLKAIVQEKWSDFPNQMAWQVGPLKKILQDTVREAEGAVISDRAYLESFGILGQETVSVADLWSYLAGQIDIEKDLAATFAAIVKNGSLSSRILKSLAGEITRRNLAKVYRELSGCLQENRLFLP
ncbi:MAG: glutamate-cysteine ligase family protein [Desulfobulbales bacterium]|jgi:carboxylate-amine ligase